MRNNIHQQSILILDFGSQTTQLIARRIREVGVYCEIVPWNVSEQFLNTFQPQGIILSGGPESAAIEPGPKVPEFIFTCGVPVLGICFGMQAMTSQLGGKTSVGRAGEFGFAQVTLAEKCCLLQDIEDHVNANGRALLDVWMNHADQVSTAPPGFTVTAHSNNGLIAAIADESRLFYGLQFHPEVTHTLQGKSIIQRFVVNICRCETLWTPDNIIADALAQLKESIGQDAVILGLSGGVDSSVVASLLHIAIGAQLTCVFVDTGLLRLKEADQVMTTFANNLAIKVVRVDAGARFFAALKGIEDPEQKRKIIGALFIDIFQAQAQQIPKAKWLAQGTIYPDVVESAATAHGNAHVIKSHHNVGGLPKTLNLKLCEPLRELFKDEVRTIGIALGLPYAMIHRHPFPGPGLAVRIIGAVKPEFVEILQQADAIFMQELQESAWLQKVDQAFAVFLPIKSVGVIGDQRRYAYVISLRAVQTNDFMTARWAHLPYELLEKISNRIINELPLVSRVTYDISGKPPATIEWE